MRHLSCTKARMGSRSLKNIATLVGGETHFHTPDHNISNLVLDSRKYQGGKNNLFIALRGENHDGHDFIEILYDKGLNNFLAEHLPHGSFPNANFIIVDDSLKALQLLAGEIRKEIAESVIAITGSNGKTVIKEWLYHLVKDDFKVAKNPKSYNSQVGVPLSIWKVKEKVDLGIFEAGISQPGEMSKLENILHPEIGIFTNIGSAHDAFFENRDQKIAEKGKLFRNCKKIIFCEDHKSIKTYLEREFPETCIGWSFINKGATLFVRTLSRRDNETLIEAEYKGLQKDITIPFQDKASIENALHCWLCALELGVKTENLKRRFKELQPVAMRLEMKSGPEGSILINDIYNSDIESISVALDFLNQQAHKRERILVLSDILQSGLDKETLYKRLEEVLSKYQIDRWIGIGKGLYSMRNTFSGEVDFYETTEAFLYNLGKYNWKQKAILLKGARDFRFEQIGRKLEQKSHETILEIHLSRMVSNLNYYRSKLGTEIKTMAMVKAFSYGSGSYEIASLLEFHKVNYLAVAYTDEGVELRKAGIKLPIMVLNAEPSSFEDLLDYDLEPEIYSFRMLENLLEVLKFRDKDQFPIHIKLDTGMHRLGFEEKNLNKLTAFLKDETSFRVESVFSHLAASDETAKSEFTKRQITLFKEMANTLEKELNYKVIKHLCNSSAINSFPEAHFDMVRLGIGLYGVSSRPEERKWLQPVNELKASVSQVKHLIKGDYIGYGLSYQCERDMTIATITLGYADGLRRSLSNGVGKVWIHNTEVPIVGRVCMDMTMVDVSNLKVEEGDEVEIIGPHQSVYELASTMGTIPYEVLTSISQRVKRVYFLE